MEDIDEIENTGKCTGCGKHEVLTTVYLPTYDENLVEEAGELCYNCCEEQGFCAGCGAFSAGIESYDFSDMGAYCDECQFEMNKEELDDDYSFYDEDL